MKLIEASTLLLIVVPLLFPPWADGQRRAQATPSVWLSQAQESPTPIPNPQDKAGVNSNIETNLRSAFSSDPGLEGADLQASVDDVAITISGSVQSEGQHRRAMAFASQYAQYRKIVDKIAVK